MSKTVSVSSSEQFFQLLTSSSILVADFYADWCGPCKTIAPLYEALSKQYSSPNKVTFTKVNVDQQQEIAGAFNVAAMPTFLIFKNGEIAQTVKGADGKQLTDAVKAAVGNGGNGAAGEGSSGSSSEYWLGAGVPRGLQDITEHVELKGIDLLNCDNEVGPGKALFTTAQPSALTQKAKESSPDWVESDTDEQLMLFLPFQSTIKLHSLQITSLPPPQGDDEEEPPMRPKTLKFYLNRPHIIGFDEADDIEPTQEVTISPEDWDAKTGTAKVELRFVKFQRVSSLVVYFVDGEGDDEKIRVDRVRIIGEAGEKKEMGKLEKFGEGGGE